MEQIIFRPKLYRFDTCEAFVSAFAPREDDLILTNAYIFEPHFSGLALPCRVLYQERYGAGEPTDVMVEQIIRDAQLSSCRRVIAIGGGTILDIAKVLAVAGDDDVGALYEAAPDLPHRRELILLPTTCGTGSEVTNIAVLNRTKLGVKMGLVAESLYATAAVLIPELLDGLPFGVFATSSIDALVHAVESILSPKATAYTKLFGYQAAEWIIRGYQRIVREGREVLPDLLDQFLTASNFAGLSFGTAGCAAVHAMSYPLGGAYHVAHGESNYAMFLGVLRAYMEIRQDGEIAGLNRFLAALLECPVGQVYEAMEKLLDQILPRKPLREYGVTEDDLCVFAESVTATQQRLLSNSFTPLDTERIYQIYQKLY